MIKQQAAAEAAVEKRRNLQLDRADKQMQKQEKEAKQFKAYQAQQQAIARCH